MARHELWFGNVRFTTPGWSSTVYPREAIVDLCEVWQIERYTRSESRIVGVLFCIRFELCNMVRIDHLKGLWNTG